jgi:chromosome segregation ATPase
MSVGKSMDTIGEAVRPEQEFDQDDRMPARLAGVHGEVAFLRRRLDRLTRLQSLVKQKYQSRLAGLAKQLDDIDSQQWELKSLGQQLRKNRERQTTIREQMASLERRKKTISEAIGQIERYRQSSNAQVRAIEEEQEVLSQRIHDLVQTLELIGQAELDRKELDTVIQRMSVTRELLEEQAGELSKRTIDLLFEFYVPPRHSRRFGF